jgi:ribonuclease P protein component
VLPKKNRLKKKKDFENIFRKGKSVKEDFLSFKWKLNGLKVSRFGFIVSQKISKKATVRNKIKRRLRELLKLNLLHLKKGIDGIFIACPGLEKKIFYDMETSIKNIFIKTKILKITD